MLYLLSHGDEEMYVPVLLEGPEVPDWEAFVLSLVEPASRIVLDVKEHSSGWWEIVDVLLVLLAERGYKRVDPPEVRFHRWSLDREEDWLPEEHKRHRAALGTTYAEIKRRELKI